MPSTVSRKEEHADAIDLRLLDRAGGRPPGGAHAVGRSIGGLEHVGDARTSDHRDSRASRYRQGDPSGTGVPGK